MTVIKDFVTGHDFTAQIAVVSGCRGIGARCSRHDLGKVVPRNHRHHAGQSLRLAGIDVHNAGMGVWAAQHLAGQHARKCHIRAELGAPGHFGQGIDLGDFVSNHTKC